MNMVKSRDLNCGRGRVFSRVAFVAVSDITDAIAVTADLKFSFAETFLCTAFALLLVLLRIERTQQCGFLWSMSSEKCFANVVSSLKGNGKVRKGGVGVWRGEGREALSSTCKWLRAPKQWLLQE
ncbi:hypothetical protein Gotur_026322 [Gossypium turneri]